MESYIKTVISGLQAWVKSLLSKSRPDFSQNDPEAADYIKNRPFYSESVETELVPETTVEFTENWVDISVPDLIRGETYFVTWDGETYKCVAVDDGFGGEALGNFALDEAGADTGEPFYIFEEGEDGCGICAKAIGIHTFSISQLTQYVHQIDPVYIPDTIALMKVTVTENWDDEGNCTYTADKTYAEITEHLQAGGDVICLYANYVYQLAGQSGSAFTDISTYAALADHYRFTCSNGDRVWTIRIVSFPDGDVVEMLDNRLADRNEAVIKPSTASVGQTIVVKAVDDEGKPTEWEAADLPSGEKIIKFYSNHEGIACNLTYEEVYEILSNDPAPFAIYNSGNHYFYLLSHADNTGANVPCVRFTFIDILNYESSYYVYYKTDGTLTEYDPNGK